MAGIYAKWILELKGVGKAWGRRVRVVSGARKDILVRTP